MGLPGCFAPSGRDAAETSATLAAPGRSPFPGVIVAVLRRTSSTLRAGSEHGRATCVGHSSVNGRESVFGSTASRQEISLIFLRTDRSQTVAAAKPNPILSFTARRTTRANDRNGRLLRSVYRSPLIRASERQALASGGVVEGISVAFASAAMKTSLEAIERIRPYLMLEPAEWSEEGSWASRSGGREGVRRRSAFMILNCAEQSMQRLPTGDEKIGQ